VRSLSDEMDEDSNICFIEKWEDRDCRQSGIRDSSAEMFVSDIQPRKADGVMNPGFKCFLFICSVLFSITFVFSALL